jgi:glutamyl-tRNA reductase
MFSFDNAEVVKHLFAVASGLDSMVLGEVQILSQVKNAYQLALDAETAGSTTHLLFQSALRTAKRIADETDLHRHRISIPSIAVSDFALRVFEKLSGKKILIFGAGEMGEETLQYLVENGAKSITVLNRHRERAESLAKQFGGGVADWNRRFEMMLNADIIVSTTGSAEPVITLDDFQPIAAKRNGLPLFILDLAVPRDVDTAVGRCSGVYLYSLDDLQETCNQNRLARDKEIPRAERLVQVAAKEFLQEINHRKNGAVIQLLREQWSKTKDNELARLFNKLPELSGKQQDEIRYAFERLTAKFLHPPLESLRDESKNGEPQKLLEALAKLFKLR